MNSIKQKIQILFENELYSNVVKICDLILTSGDKKLDYFDELLLSSYHADSLFALGQFVNAEKYFRKCITMRKNISRNKHVKSSDKCNELPRDVDLKYKVHLCLLSTKKKKEALEVLQSIKGKHRTVKINMALGSLLMEVGKDRLATIAFKEVLEECPFAIEAAENLLKLGVKGADVNSLTVEATNDVGWLQIWLKAQAQLYSKDFWNAIETLEQLDVPQYLKDNVHLLVTIGYCYHYLCEDQKAIDVLQRAYKLDSNMRRGLDLLSTLLVDTEDETQSDFLESLIPQTDMSSWYPEHWIVFANYMCNCKNYEKAGLFAHKALLVGGENNIEVLYVKAFCFFKMGKYNDAAALCLEALQICPYRLDVYKILVDCYLKINRITDADAMALNACKQMNNSPHALKLHAKVLLKDPAANAKAIKKILEKAVSVPHQSSTNTVIILALFLQQQSQYEYAEQLLLKQINSQPSSRLYLLLGDCYVNLSKEEDAFECYTTALRLDPTNQRAVECLNMLLPNFSNNKNESYYTTCEGGTSHPSQSTLASERDVESDPEYWPNNSEIITID
ncbi:anaphase-promoting complex subunit 7 [Coccinella septempunctata]|uniref:anaphase-promoting complex subunit 7 n=1 Tax=Coccinella septempunctata TaxID=41139 RepID=UPI001D096308|nr:anaphase-promoting complex subunit 7 [Coccinella septempunctata]